MSRRFHILTLSALVTLIAWGGAVVFSQGPGPNGPRGRGPGFGRGGPHAGLALHALDLTDAQREQVRQLSEQHREQMRPLVARVQAAKLTQRQAMDAIQFNEARIRAAMQSLAEAEAEVAVQHARRTSDIYALLTAEQQQRVQSMRTEREARLKQRQGRRGARPGA